jgi:alcohol dehydrogenase (cytochrome c)
MHWTDKADYRAPTGLLMGALLLSVAAAPLAAQDGAQREVAPVSDAMLADPPDGDWLMWRRTLNHWGYSPLDQINRDNVGDLRMAWSRGMAPGNLESTPLVHDGIMYLPSPKDIVEALDAVTGELIWEYRRDLPDDITDYVQLNDVTRSLAIHEDKIIDVTADGYIIALNAATGQLEWETQISDYKENTNWQTSGPIIANGKAVSGRSCEPTAGPDACFIAAHDLSTGEELWRTHTIPQPGEPGFDTWSNIPYESRWHVGSWITPSFDPELNMIYAGTSVTSPYTKYIMGAEEQDEEFLYQTSTLALDADTGEIVWYQQHIRDQWDLDHPFERILVDSQIAPNPDEVRWIAEDIEPGREYKVMTGIPGKTGIFYSIDRETGKFLWARETVHQNVILDIDTTNGRATMNEDLFFQASGQTHSVCPSLLGGKDWQAGAYSPDTNALYYPLQNMCMDATALGDEPIAEELGQLDYTYKLAPGAEHVGTIQAISAETGETLWTYENPSATMSLLTTGGGLVFGGDVAGNFRALDDQTGEVLWETKFNTPVGGFPITYEVDGQQYLAVSVGAFLISGSYLGLTPELKPSTEANNLFVFALPAAM